MSSESKKFFSRISLKGYLGAFLMVAECLIFVALFAVVNAALLLFGEEIGLSSPVMICGLTILWLLIFLPLVLAEINPDWAEWSFDDIVRRYKFGSKKDKNNA